MLVNYYVVFWVVVSLKAAAAEAAEGLQCYSR